MTALASAFAELPLAHPSACLEAPRPEHFFRGLTHCQGLLLDARGHPRRRLNGLFLGTPEDHGLTLQERLAFDDGELQERCWRIKRLDENHYRAYADELLGVARGCCHEDGFEWRYRLAVRAHGRQWRLSFRDWLFPLSPRRACNQVRMYWGPFPVGTLVLTLSKPEEELP